MKKFWIVLVLVASCLGAQERGKSLGIAFDMDVGIQYYRYEEPEVMKISGPMFVSRIGVGKTFGKFKIYGDAYWATHIGQSLYDGGLWSEDSPKIIPYQTQSTDWYLSGNLKLGFSLTKKEREILFVYGGLGYRFLHNLFIDKPWIKASYTRDQGYLYAPIGIQGEFLVAPKITLFGGLEYRVFLYGHHTSGIQENGFDKDAHFVQKSGYGGSVTLGTKFYLKNQYAIKLSVYYDFWGVAESSIFTAIKGGKPLTIVEPANRTDAAGLMLGFAF